MARTPGLLGVVAQDRAFLMAIERLDRRIDVEDPRLRKKRLRAMLKMAAQPDGAFFLVDRLEGAPYGVLADDLLHAEQFWQDCVAAQRRDMGIALVSRQHGKHRRAENVALLGRVGARIAQRTIGDKGVEQPALLEKIDEERELPERRRRRFLVPFHMHGSKKAVEIDAGRRLASDNQGLFTQWVSGRRRRIVHHAPKNARFRPIRKISTAVFRIKACPRRRQLTPKAVNATPSARLLE
jgi:hypothetical protein